MKDDTFNKVGGKKLPFINSGKLQKFCYIKQLILIELYLPLSSNRALYFKRCLSKIKSVN